MANGGERWRDEPLRGQLVMCSTCSSFVMRKKHTTIFHPDEEVVEILTEAKKMRDLMQAVLVHGPFQDKEPAEATKEEWLVLRRRRMIMMETKRCPACSRSLLGMCPTCSRSLSKKPAGPGEEDKAAESKEEKNSSREVGSELMAAKEDEAMVADAGSVKKSKRLREKGNGSGSGLKKANNDDEGSGSESEMEGSTSNKKSLDILKALPPVKPLNYATNHSLMAATKEEAMVGDAGLVKKLKGLREEGNGSSSGSEKKKAKIENKEAETEGSGPKEAETEGSGSKEAQMEVGESAGGNRKTKMVTARLGKEYIDFILKECPPSKPSADDTFDSVMVQWLLESEITQYEVECEFHEYLRRQSIIRGYADFQLEVSDDEDSGHNLV